MMPRNADLQWGLHNFDEARHIQINNTSHIKGSRIDVGSRWTSFYILIPVTTYWPRILMEESNQIKSNVVPHSCKILATNNCIIELPVEVVWAGQLVQQSETTPVNKRTPEPGIRLLQYRFKFRSVHIYLHTVITGY